jgi:hypothetical protein
MYSPTLIGKESSIMDCRLLPHELEQPGHIQHFRTLWMIRFDDLILIDGLPRTQKTAPSWAMDCHLRSRTISIVL